MGVPARSADVPSIYDLVLAPRSGNALTVKNKDGVSIDVSIVGYIAQSSDGSQPIQEETELAHKDRLIQLSSNNLIDREFDQWPRVTQGDWKGGMLQRVYSETDRYWSGLGVLWPLNDWIPQQPVFPPAYQDSPTANLDFVGTVAGNVNAGNDLGAGYAFDYLETADGLWYIVFMGGNTATRNIISPGLAHPVLDMTIGHGYIWFVSDDGANTKIWYAINSGGGTLTATIFDTIGVAANVSVISYMTTGMVGDLAYLAVSWSDATVTGYEPANVRIYDITDFTGTPNNASFVNLQFEAGWFLRGMWFVGEELWFSLTDGDNSLISAYTLSSATWRTVAQLPNVPRLTGVPIAGGFFVIAYNRGVIELYLLQGTSLQYIGPMIPQLGTDTYPFILGFSRPSVFGPYAVFALALGDGSVVEPRTFVFYAYDVLRGRLFMIAEMDSVNVQGDVPFDTPIAVFPTMKRTSPANLLCTWGIAVNVVESPGDDNIQEMLFGVSFTQQAPGPLFQGAQDITSSIIDFAGPAVSKLFRDMTVTFLPLTRMSEVILDIWLDQDPATLSATPDFTGTIIGNGATANATTLTVPINQIAYKLVYRVRATEGQPPVLPAAPISAPKIVSVSINAATGWVELLELPLIPNVQPNGNTFPDDIWTYQGIDHVAAMNFLRALWREEGGQVVATFANGDTGNYLIQDLATRAIKPTAQSDRSDIQTTWQGYVSLKIREDI